MNRRIKIIVSLLLILCYLASPVSVLAAIVETTMVNDQTKVVEISNTKRANFEMKGTLETVIGFDLPIVAKTNKVISMTLSDGDNNVKTDINLKEENNIKELTLGTQGLQIRVEKTNQSRDKVENSQDFYYLNIITEGLSQGNYSVKLEGEGFISYEYNNIEISDYSKRLSITDKKGAFALGDINGDNKINQADYDLLVSEIETQNSSNLAKYDLNCDGILDVVDLSYIASNMEENQDVNKIDGLLQNTNPIISSNNLNLSTDQNTRLVGEVENLFNKTENNVVGLQSDSTITEENPVALNMVFDKSVETSKISIELGTNQVPNKMEIVVETEDGTIKRKNYDENEKEISYLSERGEVVVIDLEGQIAVKKVTIRVTGVRNNSTLAEISKVEFLNNIYEEIPAPKMDIPENLKLTVGSEALIASWNHAVNVTGYKIKINGGKINNKIYETTKNTFTISGLENYIEYSVRVESINGNWESGYSEEVKGIPEPNRLPPVPEQINVKGDYQRASVTWKKMKDTKSYNIYYRKSGDTNYTKISGITNNSYIIYDLEDQKEYEIVISGTNHLGEGAKSQTYKATTTILEAAITHNYKLINTPKEENGIKKENELTNHIESITYKGGTVTENDDILDNNYKSYWNLDDWQSGTDYAAYAPIVTFDAEYKMDNIIVVPADTQRYGYNLTRINYWGEDGVAKSTGNIRLSAKRDSNQKIYYEIDLAQPIDAKKVQVCFATVGYARQITIAEMKFYYYDDLEKQVAELFKDDLRVELVDGVTEERIKSLEDRANTPDEYSGELHPNLNVILSDLDYARTILNDTAISDTVIVDQTVNNGRSSHLRIFLYIK